MSEEFPFTCCRCGYCCISETCPAGQFFYRVGKYEPCPGLSFQGTLASCEIAATIDPEIIGGGVGCCIKARAIKDGATYDFAALPEQLKKSIAQSRRGVRCLAII